MICGDAGQLPFSDRCYDWVLMIEVTEHVAHPEATLREVSRVLRKSGQVLLTTPNRLTHFWTRNRLRFIRACLRIARSDPTHVREFTKNELVYLLEDSGFSIVCLELVGRLSMAGTFRRRLADGFLVQATATDRR